MKNVFLYLALISAAGSTCWFSFAMRTTYSQVAATGEMGDFSIAANQMGSAYSILGIGMAGSALFAVLGLIFSVKGSVGSTREPSV
jgi:TRAP-type C4-dicarboxylate transport system permease small subunit